MGKQPTNFRFKTGDRVQATKSYDVSGRWGITMKPGDKGVVIDVDPADWQPYLVQFDNNMGGHDGFGVRGVRGKDGHCWFLSEDHLAPEDERGYVPNEEAQAQEAQDARP